MFTVEIHEHTAKSNVDGHVIRYEQYKIAIEYEDGRREWAGYIGWKPGSTACLIRTYSPREREEIERQLAELTKQAVPKSSMAPELPPELRNPDTDEDIDADDFDS